MNALSGHAAYAWVTEEQRRLNLLGRAATPYYVAPDVGELLAAHAESAPEFAMEPAILPSSDGFARLPQPVNGISSFEWNYVTDSRQYGAPAVVVAFFDVSAGPREARSVFSWHIGDTKAGEIRTWEGRLQGEAAKQDFPVFRAFLAFVNQTFIEQERVAPPRAARRRAERERKDLPDLKVVTLRRARDPNYEPSGGTREYSHRFLVRGHWHKYWMGHHGEQTSVPRFIAPYVKGPDDKPLHIPDKTLFSVVR